MGFKMIYRTPMSGSYFLKGFNLEKCGNFWKNNFSGRIWPDWGNTTWADMAGLGSIGLNLYMPSTHTNGRSTKYRIAQVTVGLVGMGLQ